MIRINLLGTAPGPADTPIEGGGMIPAVFPSQAKAIMTPDILLKLAVTILPLLGIIGYDYYADGQRQRALAVASAELQEAKVKLASLKPQVDAVMKFQENKKQLQAKIDIIRALSKERVKNVKALDALQNIIPVKTWLTRIEIKESRVVMEGLATEDVEISNFMQGLEESVFFAKVILKGVTSDRSKEGVNKKFSIETSLENM